MQLTGHPPVDFPFPTTVLFNLITNFPYQSNGYLEHMPLLVLPTYATRVRQIYGSNCEYTLPFSSCNKPATTKLDKTHQLKQNRKSHQRQRCVTRVHAHPLQFQVSKKTRSGHPIRVSHAKPNTGLAASPSHRTATDAPNRTQNSHQVDVRSTFR